MLRFCTDHRINIYINVFHCISHKALIQQNLGIFCCPGVFRAAKSLNRKNTWTASLKTQNHFKLAECYFLWSWFLKEMRLLSSRKKSEESKMFKTIISFGAVNFTIADYRSLHHEQWLEANVIYVGLNMKMDEIQEKPTVKILHPSLFQLYNCDEKQESWENLFGKTPAEKRANRVEKTINW